MFEAAADARVKPQRAGLEDDPADQIRVDLAGGLHLAARCGFDLAEDPVEFIVRQLGCRRQLDVEDALRLRDERVQLVGDLGQLSRAAFLREEAEEVDDLVVRALRDPREDVGLGRRLDLGVREQRPQLRDRRDGVAQLLDLAVDELEPALVLRGLEQSARIDSVRSRYDLLPSN